MRRLRTGTGPHGKRSGDIRKDVTEAQLAGIGSVALAYNEAEVLVDILMSLSLGLLTASAPEIVGRINGVEGKFELAKIGMREIGASEAVMALLGQSLGDSGFARYKKYRDAVIHSRILNVPAAIALTHGKRGKIDEVLLSVDALNGLYDRLVLIRLELIEACNIAIRLLTNRRVGDMVKSMAGINPLASKLVGQPTPPFEQDIQDVMARYREHQTRRLSLPPLPEFPDELLVPPKTATVPLHAALSGDKKRE